MCEVSKLYSSSNILCYCPSLGGWNWPFLVLLPLQFSQICWHFEYSTLTASYFRIWNSSAGIPSAPLALFIVMLPKSHLTSHSRMSGFRWVTTLRNYPDHYDGSLYSSSVYSCHFLIFYDSVRSLSFLSFIVPILAWNVPLISPIFLMRSLVFPIPLFSSNCFPLFLFTVHLRRASYLSFLVSGTLHSVVYVFLLYPLPFVSFLNIFAFSNFSFFG